MDIHAHACARDVMKTRSDEFFPTVKLENQRTDIITNFIASCS